MICWEVVSELILAEMPWGHPNVVLQILQNLYMTKENVEVTRVLKRKKYRLYSDFSWMTSILNNSNSRGKPRIAGLVLVSCCYNKLTERSTSSKTVGQGYPMSNWMQSQSVRRTELGFVRNLTSIIAIFSSNIKDKLWYVQACAKFVTNDSFLSVRNVETLPVQEN